MAAKRTKPAAPAAEPTALKIHTWLLELRDKPRFNESGDERQHAIEALAALESGNVDAAMFHALEIGRIQGSVEATAEAEQRIEHLHDKWAKLWLPAYKSKETKRKKTAAVYGPKLKQAIDRFLELRNKRGDKSEPSDFHLRRKAAGEAGISEKYLRNKIPAYLK